MKRKIILVTMILLIFTIQFNMIYALDPLVSQWESLTLGTTQSSIKNLEFPYKITSYYANCNKYDVYFLDSNGNNILRYTKADYKSYFVKIGDGTRKLTTNDLSYYLPIDNVKQIKLYNGGSPYTITALSFYGVQSKDTEPLEYLSTNNDLENNKFIYSFNKTPIISKSDILFTNSTENIKFTYQIIGTDLIIHPINTLTDGNYTIEIKSVTSSDLNYPDETITDIPINSFTIEQPLNFIDVFFDNLNHSIKYKFNKIISVSKEDIAFTNYIGNNQDFNIDVKDNILSIFPLTKLEGRYKIQPQKVFSVDGKESLTYIPSYILEIKGIELIHKNFGNYISADLQNLILTFDRDIKSSSIVLINNTDNTINESNLIINGKKLIIDYEAFKENTSYTLTIETLNSVDGNELKNPLVFNFKTVKSTGNGGIDTIISDILNVFTEAQNNGIKIVVLAIGIGIIFILARWLWNKTKLWLKKS